MVRYIFIQVIANEPAVCQVQTNRLHQKSFRSDPFEECDQLKLGEDNRIYRWSSKIRIQVTHQVTHKAEINTFFYLAIELSSGTKISKEKEVKVLRFLILYPIMIYLKFGQERLEIKPLGYRLEFVICDPQVTFGVGDAFVI